MQNNSINIGNISGYTRSNSGNVNDNSSNVFHELPQNFFEQTRTMLAEINERHRQELEKILAKTEATHASGNKKECANLFGKFFSLAAIADCITVSLPPLPLISWILRN